ncbi:SAF domain-containing protein [Paenibacillus sp. GCM10027627]|uniref:SAF domain-containing protein n=1 Tax=unclassified Paenibacillus TaxID=185978 RepID=UPI00363C47EF
MKKRVPLWMIWMLATATVAAILFVININASKTWSDLTPVYVAKREIPVDQKMSSSDFTRETYPTNKIPADAITEQDLKVIEGKLARISILEGQILVDRMVSGSGSIRDVVKNTGANFISMAIPIDNEDMPLEVIKNGDIVSMIGVTKRNTEAGEEIVSKYVVENIRVAQAIDDSRSGRPKIIVLVPREVGPEISKHIWAGKYNVVIDPNPFIGAKAKDTETKYIDAQGQKVDAK